MGVRHIQGGGTIIGSAAELAAHGVQEDQLAIAEDTKVLYVGDETGALPDPLLGGGSGIDLTIFRSSNKNGFQVEYNGAGVAIGAASAPVPFDTVYLAEDGTVSAPLVDDVTQENDYVTVTRQSGDGSTSITAKQQGLWLVRVLIDISAALGTTANVADLQTGKRPFVAGLAEFNDYRTFIWSSTDGDTTDPSFVLSLANVAGGDQAKEFSYCWMSFVPISVEA